MPYTEIDKDKSMDRNEAKPKLDRVEGSNVYTATGDIHVSGLDPRLITERWGEVIKKVNNGDTIDNRDIMIATLQLRQERLEQMRSLEQTLMGCIHGLDTRVTKLEQWIYFWMLFGGPAIAALVSWFISQITG